MMETILLVVGVAVAHGMPKGYQVVPGCNGCLVHESCIKAVESGKVVDDSFDLSCDHDILYSNEQLYAMDAHTDGSVTFTQMNSSWTVPALPKGGSIFSQHTNFFWPGFKAQQPEPRYPVLQPVLQYGQRLGQTGWELQSWFVWALATPPVVVKGPALKVKAGDHITSWMNFDESSQTWTVYGRNDANDEESVLKVAKSRVGNQPFNYAVHVFETVMASTNYCDLYPPDDKIEFTGVSANNGDAIKWIPRTEKTDCQQKVTTSSKGDDVKFTWVSGEHANFTDMVAHVNSLQTTWQAKVPKFENFADVKSLCGAILKGDQRYVPQGTVKEDDSANFEIPDDFDVRTNWPKCASVSGHIRDQSACGSCWAHGSTEAFNDRLCITTGETTLLSTEDTTANCGLLQCFSMGCGGGQPGMAWNWFKSAGVVTGGDHNDTGKGDTCAPYSLPSCQHHNWKPPTPAHPACPKNEYSTPAGFSTCKESGYKTPYSQDKVKAASSYSISGVKNIQSDIMQYGSVTAAFTVYNDFPAYSSGVYQHKTGSALGGHAVKILGWGTEEGTPYWLVANSWNTDWGDKGFFKILRGSDHCGIESQISAGHAAEKIVV